MRFKTKLCLLKSKRSRILLERRVNVTCVDSCTRPVSPSLPHCEMPLPSFDRITTSIVGGLPKVLV